MKQRKKWMWRHLTEELIESIRSDPNVQKMVNEMEDCVVKGELVPNAAAQTILESFLNHVKRTEEKEN